MTSTQPHMRARSLSDSTAPTKFINDAPRFDEAKRAAMPRAASTLDMYNSAVAERDLGDDPDDAFRDMAREQVDRETLRDLAQFFRNTRPPTAQYPPSAENCFGKSASGESKRWSIRSLRKGHKGKGRPSSLQLRDSTTLKTTAAGHTYMAISVPPAGGAGEGRPSLQSRLSALQQSHIAPVLGATGKESHQRRSSSVGMQCPTSPTSSANTQAFRSDRSSRTGDLAAVVSRSSSRLDKNPYQLSIRVSTAEPGVRSFLKLVDEWLDEQNPESEPQPPAKEAKAIGPAHKAKGSVVTLLSPVASEIGEEEEPDATAPRIKLNPSPTSPEGTPEPPTELPVTPPAVEPQISSFPDLAPRPQSAGPTSTTSPKSPDSKPQLSMFPNTSPAKRGTPKSPKQQKKPGNIAIKRTLEVPENNMLPDSPGFPKMLAAMTFPSPPESIGSHSASNSIASSDPNRSLATPPLTGHSSAKSPPPSNLDQRLMHQSRPPLKHYKSDGAFNSSYMSQRSIATSVGTYDATSAELSVAQAARPYHQALSSATIGSGPSRQGDASDTKDKSKRRASQESSSPEGDSQRQSTISTIDSSRQSATISERYRHSLRSDTSATSDVTATDEVYGKRRGVNRDSTESSTLDGERKRSETACSTRSTSSAGTSGTATSLAERRMARRARVREKLQRDLDASKASNLKINRPGPAVPDSVDSPVLGWFPQIGSGAPHASRKTSQGPSPLAQQSSTPETPTKTNDEQPSGHAARKSSVGDIHQLIPETVEETTTPVTPTAPKPPQWTFSPIMVEETEPGPQPEQSPSPPTLTITPIMTVANIEARSPSGTLRPLSLLTNGSSPPNVPPRSSLRDGKAGSRQRPIPVRVAKNPLELTVNTNPKSKRNSSPHIPTPPISPDPSSPRMSLPGMKPSSAPPSTGHHSWNRPLQQNRQTQSLRDKETEWLTAHQRQTAEDWRLAALKDRMRREKEITFETANGSTDRAHGEDDKEAGVSSEEERRGQPREKHRRSTLRALNANAATNGKGPSNASDDEKTPTVGISTVANTRSPDHVVEQRLLRSIVPLLESMNTTLQEMQKDSTGRELSKKFMDSALAISSPLVESAEEDVEEDAGPASNSGSPKLVAAQREHTVDTISNPER